MPFPEMEKVLDAELSRDGRGQLAFIEPVPLAAASVAQVHRGVLVSGEEVAIKIQDPVLQNRFSRMFFSWECWLPG